MDSGQIQGRQMCPHHATPVSHTLCCFSAALSVWIFRKDDACTRPLVTRCCQNTHQHCGCGSGASSSGVPVLARPLRTRSWGRHSPVGLSPSVLEVPSWNMEQPMERSSSETMGRRPQASPSLDAVYSWACWCCAGSSSCSTENPVEDSGPGAP